MLINYSNNVIAGMKTMIEDVSVAVPRSDTQSFMTHNLLADEIRMNRIVLIIWILRVRDSNGYA